MVLCCCWATTRVGLAPLLAPFSVATALIFHNALGEQNELLHFLKNFAMAGGLLQVVAFGLGSRSIDRELNIR